VTDNTDLSIKGTQNFITVSTGVLKKFTVKKDGSGDFTSISDAVNALPKTLESPYLIEVQDNYSYGENVLIAAKITNAVKTLVVRPAPSKHPLVEPFVQYAGGFDIFLTNYVTIAGFRIRGENMEFGIHIRNSSYCTIRDNYLTDADVMDGAGILLSHGGNNEIFNNVSYGNLSGIVLYDEGSDNNIIKNNIIYNNSENGIRLYRNTDNNKIYNNTFYNNNVGIFLGHGGKYYDPGINNWFYNNIIFTGIENGYGIKVNRYLAPGGLPAGTIFNYGDIFAALASVKTGHIDGTDYVSLSDWQAAAAQDGNSISSDPLFVDAEHNDFQLKCIADGYSSDSPAIDAGKTLPEVTDDFLYIPRPQGAACDIGAYE
jgi:parallel beta-helix repeat protein